MADTIRDTTAALRRDKIAPIAAEIDEKDEFPRHLWPQMGELGLHGITVEEEWWRARPRLSRACRRAGGSGAGLGLGRPELRRPLQPLRQPDPPLGATTSRSSKYLPKLISGEHVGALAMSEAGAGSDVVGMKLKAEKIGNGYRLNGTKFWITNGSDADTAGRLRQDRRGQPRASPPS